jgi:hypothetical protein
MTHEREKQSILRAKRLRRVRNVRCLRSIFGFNGMDRSLSHNGLIMGQNGYTITVMRGRIHNELYNTRD